MIQTLSSRFRRRIAASLYLTFYGQILCSMTAWATVKEPVYVVHAFSPLPMKVMGTSATTQEAASGSTAMTKRRPVRSVAPRSIGGPSTPEASSFKAVGSNNLVNLFTGDFSYSIPLLDVGGYPVNLFYNGGIGMEQEASWVGLGWNINPGSVSRNMRGVPDDFDGTDTLVQTQDVKPNKTWGGEIGIDGELIGIKEPNVNFDVGFSYNNYLGPELDIGAGVAVSIPIIKTEVYDEVAPLDNSQGLNLNLGANAKLSSRSGLTLSPSLNASMHSVSQRMDLGVGISTSYNSRTGIQDLNIHSQMQAYAEVGEEKDYVDPNRGGHFNTLSSTNISFARPSYLPTLRMPMQYSNTFGQLELGTGMFGLRGAGTIQGYYTESGVADGSVTIAKPLVGFMYLENAGGHKDAVMDFNRLNDGAVTPNTPVISAPQYDYDIFTIQGEGTGGSIRAYRSDLGFMHEHETLSKDKNISIGFDIAPTGHFGGNVNSGSMPTRSGNWDDANNTLNQALQFNANSSVNSFEHVYFRNPGEATVTNDDIINKIGRDNLVRFKLDGSTVTPRLESQVEQFSKKTGAGMGTLSVATANTTGQRDRRTQVVTMLKADDARRVGLDTSLRSYQSTLDGSNDLQYTNIPRVGGYRKGHHISEITVLEATGMRYVYGLPVYNKVQKDFTFSVGNIGDADNMVSYASSEPATTSAHITGNTGIDGYVNIQQTPAYASSFLITGLLSPDYVDVTGDGITEDDLGNAVKFDYTMSSGLHKWRTPRNNTTGNTAHFNVGLKTEKRDNKATISYGEREAWYLHSIESKSMIAFFSTSARDDARGVNSDLNGAIQLTEAVNQKLDSIMLYTKADVKAHGLSGALPLKTIHFKYSYSLCGGTPDNNGAGKLTLDSVWFTFNGQSRQSKDIYRFNYGNAASNFDNASYAYNASDRWGTYKPVLDSASAPVNPNGQNNIDYPYTSSNKAADDQYAGEWSLKKILLPSGGQMEVSYEADDYAYVQNRRACNMFNIYGLGSTPEYSQNNMLYTIYANQDQNYIYIQLPAALQNTDPVKIKQEIYSKYLDGLNQLAFKLNVNMPNGMETLTVYANYLDYGLCTNSTDRKTIYVKLAPIDNKGPLANASVHFLMENLPGQAFPGYDLSDETGITAFFDLITSELSGLANAFKNAESQMRSDGKGSSISLVNSFVRLCNPNFVKYGGGHRVKRVLVKDNWNAMSGQYDSQYGQDYDYTTTQMVNGVSTTISSGVASYEPGIGSEENPFREILQFEDQLPLASAQYGAIEMPALEALYPSPVVGYSKVTVRSINRNGTQGASVVRSAIGKQVTEFYTARDYPSFSTYTPMNNMDYHHNPAFSFFTKETIDRRTTSQGFLVETNDMHGKMKSQSAYSESDPNTPLSYTLHYYKNTGANGLNDQVDFVHNDQGGAVTSGNMGVDMELMTDVREFSVISNGLDVQAQVDFFSFVPFPVFGVFMYPLISYTENKYRAVTTTKLINYHAIEDSVIVNDKGSTITTRTLLYDGETGNPIVTKTMNEFNDPIYSTSYPAYWAYSGMAPAYKNIGMVFSGVDISSGQIVGGISNLSVFESGDELYVDPSHTGSGKPGCVPESPNTDRLWVVDMTKNTTSLTVPSASRNLLIMDASGQLFTKAGVSFQIVRSGKRNDLGVMAGSATSMLNPVRTVGGVRKLVVDSADNVVATSAATFREKWQTDRDVIPKTIFTVVSCVSIESPDCNGTLPTHLNPYNHGLLGNFKQNRSYVYYGTRAETDPAVNTTIRKNGYIPGFGNYWSFDVNNNLVPDNTNTNWVWNTECTKVNAKGQELETHDALNRYTAAQYGFAKNFPVSMVQNARNGQSLDESFEDYLYSETLNNAVGNNCDSYKYNSFSGLANSSIISSDGLPFKAHTGQYMVKINGNSQLTKPLAVSAQALDSYSFWTASDTTGALADEGGVVTNLEISPVNTNNGSTAHVLSFNNGFGASLSTSIQDSNSFQSNNTTRVQHAFNMQTTQYMQITQPDTYTLSFGVDNGNDASEGFAQINIDVSDAGGNIVTSQNINNVQYNAIGSVMFSLCPGIYKIDCEFTNNYDTSVTGHVLGLHTQHPCDFSYHINTTSPSYKDTVKTTDCIFNKPLPSSDSMFNQSFALVPNQQMQFSAWIRQDCGNATGTPCYLTNYPNTHVTLQFPGSSTPSITLKPSGVLIEGWQKVEGTFIVPANATTANLLLASDSAVNVYFDDIRLHPFNADMKSYVYDPRTLRLSAELDENNYATFYEYDEEGQLVRVKKETIQGIKTIKETRTAKQKSVNAIQ
ncbi:MAG TPA: hypothetical protein VGM30_12240 [Puia sp.]|jgi:hypothetical protein